MTTQTTRAALKATKERLYQEATEHKITVTEARRQYLVALQNALEAETASR